MRKITSRTGFCGLLRDDDGRRENRGSNEASDCTVTALVIPELYSLWPGIKVSPDVSLRSDLGSPPPPVGGLETLGLASYGLRGLEFQGLSDSRFGERWPHQQEAIQFRAVNTMTPKPLPAESLS